jgi:cell division protein FtsQ
VSQLPKSLAQKVVRVRAQSIDSVELDLKSGAVVRWGSADEPEFKAAVLEALLSLRAQIYDVSAPELPTTTDEKGPKKR